MNPSFDYEGMHTSDLDHEVARQPGLDAQIEQNLDAFIVETAKKLQPS